MSAAIGSAFPTAERMSHRVLSFAANMGFSPHMAIASGFSHSNVLMIGISNLTDGRPTSQGDHSHFSAGKD